MRDVLLEKVFERLLAEGYDKSLQGVIDMLSIYAGDLIERLGMPASRADIQEFVLENEKDWRRVLSFGKLNHLETEGSGRGIIGLVFAIGDHVLKLQRMDGDHKTMGDKFYDALMKDKSIAPYVPMVYDHGVMVVPDPWEPGEITDKIEWHVAELVDTIPHEIMRDMQDVFAAIMMRKNVRDPRTVAREVRESLSEEIARVEEVMRPGNGWLVSLVKAYRRMLDANLSDLHPGNVGFRKNTGQPVFFDA